MNPTKLEKLTSRQWKLAEEMEKKESHQHFMLAMFQFQQVTIDIYMEESRLEGLTRQQAIKRMAQTFEQTNTPMPLGIKL